MSRNFWLLFSARAISYFGTYRVLGAVWILVTTAIVFSVRDVRDYGLPAAAMATS